MGLRGLGTQQLGGGGLLLPLTPRRSQCSAQSQADWHVLSSPCPVSLLQGHSKSIQCLTVHRNGGKSYIYSGSHDGHINIL